MEHTVQSNFSRKAYAEESLMERRGIETVSRRFHPPLDRSKVMLSFSLLEISIRISQKELELLSLRFDILPFPGLRDGFLDSRLGFPLLF